uniref:Uncharacterized protein n=2 Tax=Timema TaxID=61471 RepID=A0A7R9DSV6_TIMPO|nr:unnamed protein product [Timema douglasi]CAD7420272.1 unnamed protein product [Timema poppensis]
MGNCLKKSTNDDISLLRGSESTRDASSSDQLGPPPPYEEAIPVYYPSPNVRRFASQLSEEEQIKIAKRIGLIQHLPIGTYDGSKKNRE